MEMLVNPTGLTDEEVRTTLVQMAQSITLQAQAMTAQAEQQGVPMENPPASTMVNRLSDITRMNPPFFTGSKTSEDPRSLWTRCIRSWWLWGPQILRKQSWLPINSRMFHRLGARCGKIVEFWGKFRSLGSCLRQPFWRYSFPER